MTTAQPHSRWDILTGDADRDRRNVQILLASVEELYSPGDSAEVTRQALDRAIEVTGAKRGVILVEDDAGGLSPHAARSAEGEDLPLDLRYSRSVARRVWEEGTAEVMIDAEDESATALGQSILDLRLLSIMATPLDAKDNRLGVLYVDSTVQTREFNQADLAVFKALGGMVAIAIENGRLLEERAAKERMARELGVAREIQQSLFPRDLPQPTGYQIAAVGRPCDETSGDYYDVIPLGDGRMALIMGDVSGHGLGAALFMTQTRALLHSLLRTVDDPARVVAALNDHLERDMPVSGFLTLFLAILDPTAGTLRYVNAGHNPPLWLKPDGALESWGSTGPLLGVIPGADFEIGGPIPLGPGEVCMLYTDGIFEAHDMAGDMYGEPRFQASVVRHAQAGADAQGILDGSLQDLFAFCGERPLDDDVTALVVRVDR